MNYHPIKYPKDSKIESNDIKPINQKQSYYDILGVKKDASLIEIKKAFKREARMYHPSKGSLPLSNKSFAELTQAYTVLSNEKRRLLYDKFGEQGLEIELGGECLNEYCFYTINTKTDNMNEKQEIKDDTKTSNVGLNPASSNKDQVECKCQ